MRLFPRRRPSWVADFRSHLDPGERPLAWATYTGGRLLATTRGLWTLPDSAEAARAFWDEIGRATWRDSRLAVHVLESDTETTYAVSEPGSLPRVVRDRVTASIMLNTTHQLARGGGVRIAARRRAGEGALRWVVIFERPGDAADPLARAEADQLVAAARQSLGD